MMSAASKREPDPLERGLVGGLGNLFRRQVRGEIERRCQDRREADVEDEAEHAKGSANNAM